MSSTVQKGLKYIDIGDALVREEQAKEIDNHILLIANEIIDNNIMWLGKDEQSAGEIADIMMKHLNLNEYTYDEFDFAVTWVHFYCALKFAYKNGLLKDDKWVPPELKN